IQDGAPAAELNLTALRQYGNMIAVDGGFQRAVLVPRLMYVANETPEDSYPLFYDPANDTYTPLDRGGAYAQISGVRLSLNGLSVVTTDSAVEVTVWDLMTLVRTDLGSTPADTRIAHRLTTLPAGGLYVRIEVDRESAFDISRTAVVFDENDAVVASVDIRGPMTRRVEAHLSGDGSRLLIEQQLSGMRVYDVAALAAAGGAVLELGVTETPLRDFSPAQPISLACGLPVTDLLPGATVQPTGGTPARLRATPGLTGEQVGLLPADQTAVYQSGSYACVEGITWVLVRSDVTSAAWVAASTADEVLLTATLPDGAPRPLNAALSSPVFNTDASVVLSLGSMGVLAFDAADLSAPPLLTRLPGGNFIPHPNEPNHAWATTWLPGADSTTARVEWYEVNWLTGNTLQSLSLPEVEVFALRSVIPDPSGAGLYVVAQDLFAYVDFATGTFTKLVEDVTNNGLITNFTLSADGQHFAYTRRSQASPDQDVYLFERATGQNRLIMTVNAFFAPSVIEAVSLSGQQVAVRVAQDALAVWSTGEQPSELYRLTSAWPQRTQFTPDGAHLVVNDRGGIALFDAADGRDLQRFDLPADTLTFSADGSRAAAIDTHTDGLTTLTVYQLPAWEVVSRFSPPMP
nr:hypothetical protein [Anaerolineae bacterium]